MSSQQVRSIEQYFPTEPWLESYRVAIEDDEDLSESGSGWGVDFQGAMIFQIEDVPLVDHTIADLPDELTEAISEAIRSTGEVKLSNVVKNAPEQFSEAVDARDGDVRDRLIAELEATSLAAAPERIPGDLRAELPEVVQALLTQIEENVVDGTVYAYLDVYDGGCREVEALTSLDERAFGFRIIGDYTEWKELVQGEGGVINKLMSGGLDVDGDMQKILQYSEAAVDLADIASTVDSRFVV